MISYVSLRLDISSEKCHYCHCKACLCDEIYKEWSDILGIYMQSIQMLAVCCLETQFCPYVFTCFSWSGVLGLWQEGLHDNLPWFADVWSVQTQLIRWG